jgi:membrane fusion protein, multidrug efflux system
MEREAGGGELSDDSLSGPAMAREPATVPPPPRALGVRIRSLLPSLFAAVLAVALAVGLLTNWNRWVGAAGAQWTDDAYLQADLTPLSAQVAGRVLSVAVEDFARVKAGQLLVEIDEAPFRASLAQAEANVAGAHAAIRNLDAQEHLQEANIAAAEAQLQGVQATEVRNELEARRQHALLATRIAGTEQLVEQADAAWKQSQAQAAQAAAAVEAAKRQLDVQKSQQAQLDASLKAAEAERDLAEINLGYTRIAAPTNGMVSQRRVFAGQYVGVGTQVISVVPLAHLYVIANYKETQLTHLTIGQPATIRVDTFSTVTLHGHVVGWSPATGSQFALLPPDNATGNFTKVVQRIPVKLLIDDDGGLGDRLRPGMSVEATVDTSAQPGTDAGNNP